jgi:hypothetical protein
MPGSSMAFASYLEAFALGFTEVFKDTLKAHPRSYTKFLAEETAEHFYDTDWSVSGLGAMPTKNIGASFSTDRIIKGGQKQFGMTPYGMACVIEYEAMRWDLYSVFKGLPEELARSMTDRYNIVGHSILNNSFSAPNSTYQIFASGVAENILSSTHVRLDGGTWSNLSASATGLSYLGIQEGVTNLNKLVNQRGRYVMVSSKTLVTSEEQRWIAETLFGSEYRPDNANRALNTIKNSHDVYSSPYITSTTAWWLVGNTKDIRIKMRLGDSPQIRKDNDVRNLSLVMTCYASFDLAVYDSRGLFGSAGA